MSDTERKEVYEDKDSWYSGTLTDNADSPVTQSNVATLTMTLFEKRTGTVINGRDSYDLTNSGSWNGNATISDAGIVTIRLEPGDNAIVAGDHPGKNEIHVIYLEGTTSGVPSYEFATEFEYEVKNSRKA